MDIMNIVNIILAKYKFLIIGAGGSGKDTLANSFVKTYEGYLRKITRYTSRAKRINEIDGVDYHFITYPDYLQKVKSDSFLFYSDYKMTANNSTTTVGYGTLVEDFIPGTISIVSMREFINAINNNKLEYINDDYTKIIYLYVDKDSRIKKMIERGDEESECFRRADSDDNDILEMISLLNEVEIPNMISITNLKYKYPVNEIMGLSVKRILEKYKEF